MRRMSPRDDQDGPKDPFRMLEKSHRRLLENLELLRDGLAQLPSPHAADAIREVADFVARTVARHERDEEQSLFPRIQDDGDLAPILAELAAQHRAHEALHAELAELAAAEPLDAGRLLDLSRRLDAAYERHVDIEETRVFPAARAALGAAELAAMADEMQARRGRGGGGGGGRRGLHD
jgi:hemerythrin-like domain-containing protein